MVTNVGAQGTKNSRTHRLEFGKTSRTRKKADHCNGWQLSWRGQRKKKKRNRERQEMRFLKRAESEGRIRQVSSKVGYTENLRKNKTTGAVEATKGS